MQNHEIEQLEAEVVQLALNLKDFQKGVASRTSENYNHLGTLDVNLKGLRRRVTDLIEALGYRA